MDRMYGMEWSAVAGIGRPRVLSKLDEPGINAGLTKQHEQGFGG